MGDAEQPALERHEVDALLIFAGRLNRPQGGETLIIKVACCDRSSPMKLSYVRAAANKMRYYAEISVSWLAYLSRLSVAVPRD